jgi:Chaperone of endosialidase
MKTIKISIIIAMALLTVEASAQLKVLSNGSVGIATTNPQSKLDVNGNIQISNATIPMGLITEVGGTNPLLNMSVNFRETNKNTSYLGGAFRIDTRNTSTMPMFQWWSRKAGGLEYLLMELNSNGQLGIGLHPSYKLDVAGTIRVDGTLYNSDERIKNNIKSMTGALKSVNNLRGVTYRLKSNGINSFSKLNSASGKQSDSTGYSDHKTSPDSAFYSRTHMGFIAQEVQKIFPELVYTDKDGILSVDYISLIPVLVEAIKEMNNKNVMDSISFQNKLANLEKRLNQCCNTPKTKSAEATTSLEQDASVSQALLYQNIPNPFTQNTEIRYYLPEDTRSASLYLYNMQGAQIKCIPIFTRGNGSETINGSELKAGMYLYSLIADGREIDTKRMILTQ